MILKNWYPFLQVHSAAWKNILERRIEMLLDKINGVWDCFIITRGVGGVLGDVRGATCSFEILQNQE